MPDKVIFTPVIVESLAECSAEIAEFGIRVVIKGRPVREQAVAGLHVLLGSYCQWIVDLEYKFLGMFDAQVHLAERVVTYGFEFRAQ